MRSIGGVAGRGISAARALVEGVAFWTGVVLPFFYLPFVVVGVGVTVEFRTLISLLAVNYLRTTRTTHRSDPAPPRPLPLSRPTALSTLRWRHH